MKGGDEAADNHDGVNDEIEQHQLTVTSLSGKPLLGDASENDNHFTVQVKKNNAKQEKKREKDRIDALRSRFVAPDGGYGWLVAFGAFLVQFWIAGLIKSYGVIFMEVMQLYSDASASLASWIPAILSCLSLMLAPTASGLCQKFSCRSVVFCGGLFCWLGLSLSFFATNLPQLCLTFGVLTGIGAGLSTTPGIIMTSRYFSKHRALANGICVSGTAAGSMAIPPLVQLLVPLYGFKGSILILGACMLHVCLSAMLYRPIEDHQALVEHEKKKSELQVELGDSPSQKSVAYNHQVSLCVPDRHLTSIPEDDISVNENSNDLRPPTPSRPRGWSMVHSMEDLSTDSTIYFKEEKNKPQSSKTEECSNNRKQKKSCSESIGRYIDFSLLKNPLFVLLTGTVMMMAVGCPHALYYVPSYANSLGLSRSDCGLLLSISAVLDFLGRIGVGYVADLNIFSSSKAYSLSMLTTGIAVLCIPFATTFATFAVIVSFYGLGLGSWFLLIPVLLNEHHGTDSIASSYGLVRLFQGTVTLVVPPLIGFSKDATGSYLTGFYTMGISMILGAIIINFEPFIKRQLIRKNEISLPSEK